MKNGMNKKMDIREQAIKNLTMKNKEKMVNPVKISNRIGEEVVDQNADQILRDLAIKRLRAKGMVIGNDGAVTNDGYGREFKIVNGSGNDLLINFSGSDSISG